MTYIFHQGPLRVVPGLSHLSCHYHLPEGEEYHLDWLKSIRVLLFFLFLPRRLLPPSPDLAAPGLVGGKKSCHCDWYLSSSRHYTTLREPPN